MGVTVEPTTATNQKVTWSVTAGTGSATISNSGLLTATGVGKVTVKALAQDGSGKDDTKEITINADLAAYHAALLAVTEGDYTAASWSTYQGIVAANIVTITNTQEEVTTATNNIIAAQDDLIIPVTGISISGDNAVANGESLQLTAVITPDNASDKKVTWSVTAGTGSATINTDGLLNPTSEGTVTVKVVSQYSTSITATKEITITESALDAAKANAKTQLGSYVDAAHYTTNVTALNTAIADGKSAITAATDIAGVNTALANAKSTIDAIKSDAEIAAEELATAKNDAKSALDTYVNADNYTTNKAALTTAIADGKTAIDNASDKAGVATALTDAKAVINAIKSDKELDDDDIASAKTNIEDATYTASQVDASDASAALSKAQALVNALELEGTTANVVAGTFTGAVAGTVGDIHGTNGTYTFTVTIDKGVGTQKTTTEQTMTITATPYDSTAQDNADIASAKTNIEAATYTASQTEASDAAKALTKAKALVNALDLKGTTVNIVAGTFEAATAGTVEDTGGTDGSYTFTVEINKGLGDEVTTTEKTMTITATAYNPAQDIADIATAKTNIEEASYTTTQELVDNKTAALEKVEEIINGLDTAGTITEVVPGSFSGAIAGVDGVFTPTNGSYSFTVKINKGGGTEVMTEVRTLTITATVNEVSKASKITVDGKTLDSNNPYLVNGDAVASGTLGSGGCTAEFKNGVLTLQGYNGGGIITSYEDTSPDLIIRLIDNNTVITADRASSIYNGHYGNIYITSDNDATLNVNSTIDNNYVYAIATKDNGGKSIIIGGKANVTVTATTTGGSNNASVVHAGKDFIIQDDASFKGTSESIATGGYAIYAGGKIVIDTTGNVDLDCSDSSKSYALRGMGGVDIKNLTLMTLKISEGGTYMTGTVDLSRVAVHINKTNKIATYRGGVPYNLTLSNGQITAVKDLVIGTEIQYKYQGLENDEITIKAKEIDNFAFVKWTNQDGTDLDSAVVFIGGTSAIGPEATIKMPANDLNIKAEYESTLFTTQPSFNRVEEKITWSIGGVTAYGKLQKKNESDNWEERSYPQIDSTEASNGEIGVSNSSGHTYNYVPDGTYRLKFTISGGLVGFKDHYSEEFVVQWKDTITIPEIPGVTASVTGATPVTTITETDQYTGTVVWSGTPTTFAGDTVYTATITLKAKSGYKLDGVAANFFTVAGATTVNNDANSGVVTAVFPVTAPAEQSPPTGLAGVAPSSAASKDGKITGTTTEMEYKLSSATEWIKVTATEITGLATGTYHIRYAAKTGYKASPIIEVTVPEYAISTDATLTSTIGTVDHTAGTIAAIPDGTLLADFKAAITPATGATYEVYEADGTTVATDLATDYKVIVTAEDTTTTKTYTVTFSDFAGGLGTVSSPYLVSTAEQLNKVRNYLDKHFIQTANIYLTDYLAEGGAGYNGGKGWVAIGEDGTFDGDYMKRSFKGTYNGDDFVISGLRINRLEENCQGLFATMGSSTAKLEKINLTNVNITGNEKLGGLIGHSNNGTIKNCSVSGSITGTSYVGGLIGNQTYGTTESCNTTGTVNGTSEIGGLVGYQGSSAKIISSYSSSSVGGSSNSIGGLVGKNVGSINNSYATGAVTGSNYVGGLVGKNTSTKAITNCYASGKVTATTTNTKIMGGLVGENGTTVPDSSYYDSTTTTQSDEGKGDGKTTAEMKQADTFAGWETSIWNIADGSYPTLK